MQQQHSDKKLKKGFTTITSVLILMIATAMIITSTILVSNDSFTTSFNSLSSIEARSLAHSCAEIAINKLKLNTAYTGNETLSFSGESCTIYNITGTGNTNREINTSSTVRNVTRKVHTHISTVNPSTIVTLWDEVPEIMTAGNCSALYKITNAYLNGFTADVTITNNTPTDINGWTITWNFPGNQTILNAWNTGWSQSGNLFTGTNLGYNSLIAADGGSQTFGFEASYTGYNYAPVDSIILVNGSPCDAILDGVIEDPGVPNSNYCQVNYTITSQWANGFNADVVITNISANNISTWSLLWNFTGNQVITNAWNTLWSQTGTAVTANDAVYNQIILANGGTQAFGFQGSYSGANNPLLSSNFTLNGIQCQ